MKKTIVSRAILVPAILVNAALFLLPSVNQAQGTLSQSPATQQPPAKQAAMASNAVLGQVKDLVATMSKNIVAGAQEMPPDKYDFRPTPAQNTFGHLIVHMIHANFNFCSLMSGAGPYTSPMPKDADPKDALVTTLKSSFDYCSQKLAALDDSKLETMVCAGRGSVAIGTILVTFSQDYGDHYAQESAYLRAAGLLPPTASTQPAAPAR
jgi:hypothetical protein